MSSTNNPITNLASLDFTNSFKVAARDAGINFSEADAWIAIRVNEMTNITLEDGTRLPIGEDGIIVLKRGNEIKTLHPNEFIKSYCSAEDLSNEIDGVKRLLPELKDDPSLEKYLGAEGLRKIEVMDIPQVGESFDE